MPLSFPSRPSRTGARTRAACWTLTALAALSLAVSVTACSGPGTGGAQESPTVDPLEVAASVRASTTATASLSAKDEELRATALAMEAPARPAQMDQDTPEGAVAAAEYFISLYPYVYATGDLTEWEAMSEDTCIFCQSVRDQVTELHDAGGWADPWEQSTTVTFVGQARDDASTMAVRLDVTGGERVTHDPYVVSSTTPQDANEVTLQLRWETEAWVVQKGNVQ